MYIYTHTYILILLCFVPPPSEIAVIGNSNMEMANLDARFGFLVKNMHIGTLHRFWGPNALCLVAAVVVVVVHACMHAYYDYYL